MYIFSSLQKMQNIKQCVRFISDRLFKTTNSNYLSSIQRSYYYFKSDDEDETTGFLKYNNVVFPPQKPNEERRPGVNIILINN